MTARNTRSKGFLTFVADFFHGLWVALIAALSVVGVAAVVLIAAWWTSGREVQISLDSSNSIEISAPNLPQIVSLTTLPQEPAGPRVVYLNREGASLTAGPDDSDLNVSSVVASSGMESFDVPAYHGSNAAWNSIVSCVQDQFEAYDVEVVDRRPVSGSYVMAMVGGRSGELQATTNALGNSGRPMSGLAPMNGHVIEDAVVFVFARQITSGARVVCETVAHEVAHAYGLDHTMNARDPMSYLPRRARRSFQDQEAQCGERAARVCTDGQASQNSHQELLRTLGPNRNGEAS